MKLVDYAKKIMGKPQCYIRNHKNFVGEGSSRLVIKYKNHVLKIAKNKKGYAQNQEELVIHDIIKNTYPSIYRYIGKIFDFVTDKNGIAVIIMKYYGDKSPFHKRLSKSKKEKNPKIENIRRIAIKIAKFLVENHSFFDWTLSDLGVASSWRKTKNNIPILIDYGYTLISQKAYF